MMESVGIWRLEDSPVLTRQSSAEGKRQLDLAFDLHFLCNLAIGSHPRWSCVSPVLARHPGGRLDDGTRRESGTLGDSLRFGLARRVFGFRID